MNVFFPRTEPFFWINLTFFLFFLHQYREEWKDWEGSGGLGQWSGHKVRGKDWKGFCGSSSGDTWEYGSIGTTMCSVRTTVHNMHTVHN